MHFAKEGALLYGLGMNKEQRKTKESDGKPRGKWANKTEYLLVVAGNVVGLGNVWRFPYLCYKNGGGTFLVPYTMFAVLCGIPLFLMESVIGQYTQEGVVTCWRKLCPLAQGIGYGFLVIKLYDFTYIVIQAWVLLYLIFSFRAQIPWANCGQSWNTDNCVDLEQSNMTVGNLTNTTSAAIEFWERRALSISGGIEELGSVRWDLALCLLACWTFCYFTIWKGVRSSGKVVYFTAVFPYVMLLVLLIRGVTLPGAWEGIKYYLYPDLKHLAGFEVEHCMETMCIAQCLICFLGTIQYDCYDKVWVEAGSQIFLSYSLASGTLIVLGSYNEYNNNCYKDTFLLCLLNSGTSFVAGFVVFSILGFMAERKGVPVDMVADSGPSLAFIAYPQATALMPLPQFWTSCFFLMLILLSVDTHFVTVECFVTSVSDLFPKHFQAPRRSEIFVLLICIASYLIQLILVSEGGIYIFQLIDYYGCNRMCIDIMAVCQCLTVGWIFGKRIHQCTSERADRMYDIIEEMMGTRPCFYFKLCWKYFVPLLSMGSFIVYMGTYTQMEILSTYIYPYWAHVLGWIMTLSSIIFVPLFAIVQICLGTGPLRQVSVSYVIFVLVVSYHITIS
ncbi:Sodium- and chloride-dependent GABA transporter 2 [Merluccius polli]|uniref:Transporter n=1 Tax=Merluccius polli TaxID=89951 RepID=A0AA47NQB9_MERPO|nr:Sodium- and chloride-dependent GABA transporter 2 [Merluccius polli]